MLDDKPELKDEAKEPTPEAVSLDERELKAVETAFDLAIKHSPNSMQLSMILFPVGKKLGVYRVQESE